MYKNVELQSNIKLYAFVPNPPIKLTSRPKTKEKQISN